MKIAVCDDEPYCRENLRKCLEKFLTEHCLPSEIDEFSSGEDFLNCGAEIAQYTILFLDIEMETVSGITVAQQIRRFNKEIRIVFVTAYLQYIQDGYKYGIFRYIIKQKGHLQETVDECMEALLEQSRYVAVSKRFDFREKSVELPLDQIMFIESRLHHLEFYLVGQKGAMYTMRTTLNAMEAELKESHFIRAHQSYLVNLKYIRSLKNYRILMLDGTSVSVPKVRYKEVKEQFMKWKGEL